MQKQGNNIYRVIYRLVGAGAILIAIAWGWFYMYQRELLAAADDKKQVESFREELTEAQNRPLELIVNGKKEGIVPANEIKEWVEQYTRSYTGSTDLRISSDKVGGYVSDLAKTTNRFPVNAKIRFENGRATEFAASSPGRILKTHETQASIIQALVSGQSSAEMYFEYTDPEITLDKVNQLGINSLIGRGQSDFAGSSASRIYNIKLGASKFNGTVVAPGEEFSFNKVLGAVDEGSGFQAELVIKNGKLERELGGGICQVSTTLFRAAIYSGFPILERKPHSFAVRYYNPQGFDSTIYPGVVDLRFKNDTPGHILIQSYVTGTKLTFEIYGTDTGRVVNIEGPFQYDVQSTGAMKAYFIRKISHNGETTQTQFNSIYKPPPSAQERNPLE